MRQMSLVVITFLIGFMLAGCSASNQQDNTNDEKGSSSSNVDNLEKEEGFVANIKEPENVSEDKDDAYADWYYMLVIPGIEDVDISEKTKDELEGLAQKNDGAYYNVHPDLYNENDLDAGVKVNIYWDKKEGEGEMNPPVRDAEKIDVISE